MSIEKKIKMINISKSFPGIKALDQVTFEADRGEIVGLVGVNGAGKSTLMNVLGGIFQPDEGEIFIDGEREVFQSAKDAERKGIAFIHQELIFFESQSVAENIFISNMFNIKRFPIFISKKTAYKEAKKYLKILGSDIKPELKIENISTGERQIVEIARALAIGSDLVIFDEPTSSLSLNEKEKLFKVIRNLKKEGKAIIYITHFLNEVMEICDRFFVLRNGIINGRGDIKDIEKNDIIKMIIGKELKYDKKLCRNVPENPILKVQNLKSGKILKDVNFLLNKGEILGIWGLMGSGRTEIVRAIIGLDKIDSGKIYISSNGELHLIAPKKMLRYCGYITENRYIDGLFLKKALWKNISVTSLNDYSSRFFNILDIKKEIDISVKYINLLRISTPSYNTKVESLSGGNQQKVVFAKWFSKKTEILIMDEPTRGVDVGAKLEIHNLIRQYTQEGVSIILISSEIEEIVTLSDRVIVIKDGTIIGNLTGSDINNSRLMKMSLIGGKFSE